MGKNVSVKFVTELGTQCTATGAADQSAEDGARKGSEGDSERTGNSADGGACLTACQCGTNATRSSADSADGSRNFHGLVEGSYFG